MNQDALRISSMRTAVTQAGWRNWVFIELTTDNGLHGVGEATMRSREQAVLGALQDLFRQLKGRDAREIQPVWSSLFGDLSWRGGPVLMTALSAIDQALWDLWARALGVPLYRLLGGSGAPLPAYANGWAMDAVTPDDCLRGLDHVLACGYRAAKWDPFQKSGPYLETSVLEAARAQVRAVRAAVGKEFRLLIEMHGRFEPATALRAAEALAEFDCFWIEEPVPPENPGGLIEVCRRSPIAVAAGERLFHRHQFRDVLRPDGIRVAQPDLCHAGGISECLRIAAMADTWQIGYAPHNTSGPVGTSAALHTDAVAANFLIQESFPLDLPLWQEIAQTDTKLRDGAFHLSDAPGLGVHLNWDAIAARPGMAVDRFHR
jgi:galactonate dehydratase